jgi:hypothetical protein
MFKRVIKQRIKKEHKKELEDANDYLGLNDVDSDDSDSSSSDDTNSQEFNPEDESSISVTQALDTPIFSSEIDEDTKSCYICPRVLLKNEKMVTVHLESNVGKSHFSVYSVRLSMIFYSKDS